MNKGLIMIAVGMMGFFIMGIVLFVISSVIFPPLAAFILFLMICDLVLAFFFLILGFVLDPPSGKVKEMGKPDWVEKCNAWLLKKGYITKKKYIALTGKKK